MAKSRLKSKSEYASELERRLAMPITQLELSLRTSNCLKSENIMTVGQLIRLSEEDLLAIRNFSKTSIREIKCKLAELSLGSVSRKRGVNQWVWAITIGDENSGIIIDTYLVSANDIEIAIIKAKVLASHAESNPEYDIVVRDAVRKERLDG